MHSGDPVVEILAHYIVGLQWLECFLLGVSGGRDVGIGMLTEEIALGLLVGVLGPLVVVRLER